MPIPSSGPVSLSTIKNFLGGTTPTSLTEYYFPYGIVDGNTIIKGKVGGTNKFNTGMARAYYAGGWYSSSAGISFDIMNSIEQLSNTNRVLSVTLSSDRYALTGTQSSTTGYFAGGMNYVSGLYTTTIDGLLFSNETKTSPTATLSSTRGNGGSVQTSTIGYFTGVTTVIDGINFSNETYKTVTSTGPNIMNSAGLTSSTKGYWAGGTVGLFGTSSAIYSMLFSNETTGAISATMAGGRAGGAGVYSSTKGYIFGGYSGLFTYPLTAYSLLYSNDTTGTLANSIPAAVYSVAPISAQTYGTAMYGGSLSFITKLTFSNESFSMIDVNSMPLGQTPGSAYYSGAGATPLTISISNFNGSNGYSGYLAGQASRLTSIDYIRFVSGTVGVLSEVTSLARYGGAGMSSPTAGYFAGGTPSNAVWTDTVDSVSFATETTSYKGHQLSVAKANTASAGSAYRGYTFGGDGYSSYLSNIDSYIYSVDTGVPIVTAFEAADSYGGGSINSNIQGYIPGGRSSGGALDKIYGFKFATNTYLGATGLVLTAPTTLTGGLNSFKGGYIISGTANNSMIQAIDFGNNSVSITSMNLTVPRYTVTGIKSYSYGYVVGGYRNGLNQWSNLVDVIAYSSGTISSFGTSMTNPTITAGAQSGMI